MGALLSPFCELREIQRPTPLKVLISGQNISITNTIKSSYQYQAILWRRPIYALTVVNKKLRKEQVLKDFLILIVLVLEVLKFFGRYAFQTIPVVCTRGIIQVIIQGIIQKKKYKCSWYDTIKLECGDFSPGSDRAQSCLI